MFGEEMSEFAFKYFNILTFIFAVGVIVFITAIKIF